MCNSTGHPFECEVSLFESFRSRFDSPQRGLRQCVEEGAEGYGKDNSKDWGDDYDDVGNFFAGDGTDICKEGYGAEPKDSGYDDGCMGKIDATDDGGSNKSEGNSRNVTDAARGEKGGLLVCTVGEGYGAEPRGAGYDDGGSCDMDSGVSRLGEAAGLGVATDDGGGNTGEGNGGSNQKGRCAHAGFTGHFFIGDCAAEGARLPPLSPMPMMSPLPPLPLMWGVGR